MATTRRSTRPAPSTARAPKQRSAAPEASDDRAPAGRRQGAASQANAGRAKASAGDTNARRGAGSPADDGSPRGRAKAGSSAAAGRAVGGRGRAASSAAAGRSVGGRGRGASSAATDSTGRGRGKAAGSATAGRGRAQAAGDGAKRGGSRPLDLEPYTAHLGRRAGAERPSLPVRVMLLEADRLRKAAEGYAAQLKKLPGFVADHLRDLPALIALLSEAEKVWGRARFAKSQSSRGALRKEAEELRSAVMNAGRYLLRRDAAAQAELARIAEGEGLADLVQDLDDLAELLEAHAATFALDRRLPKQAPARARQLADELRQIELDDGGAMRARNLAASALDFVLGEVRAAARYLFADEPRTLAPFLSRYDALRASRSRARRKTKDEGAPPALTPEEA